VTLARDNPFSTDRVLRVRYRPQGWTWDGLLARLASLNHRAAIVGPEGRGKTTLLEDLGGKLSAAGWGVKQVGVSRGRRTLSRASLRECFGTVSRRDVILLDGAEQMPRLAWWDFLRRSSRAGGLVITSHRPGLLPTLVACETSVELLRGIVDQLAPGAGSGDGLEALYARHGGNLRDALRALYDVHAGA
jgi:hypothetical protein